MVMETSASMQVAARGNAKARPFEELSGDCLRRVDFVLTDIDDTLTSEGRLPAVAYDALERLSAAGVVVIPVTGRPAGWCDLIARLWPVAAVVGENGAFYFARQEGGGMARVYQADDDTRERDRARLRDIARNVADVVPSSRPAADQRFRETDLAIDFAEDVPTLPDEAIDRIVACFEAAGAVAKVSSIHVNGWFGSHDKLTMTRRLLHDRFACDIDDENRRVLYAGDSPNDGPMFAFFDNGVAVANYMRGRSPASEWPNYVTRHAGGRGFAEIAERILAARAT
jgi:HAD superfamily hydrolase (TIGR01484 family)